jgi:hypothetical protein
MTLREADEVIDDWIEFYKLSSIIRKGNILLWAKYCESLRKKKLHKSVNFQEVTPKWKS